jgi:hypothetical protein
MATETEQTMEESVQTVMASMPPPIRSFFASGKIDGISKNLMQKYQLHIDTATIVEREIIFLLLGLKNPNAFMQTLAQEASLDQKTINGIMQDLNDQVFVPIQNEMRTNAKAAPQPIAKPAAIPAGAVPLPPKVVMPLKKPSPLQDALRRALPSIAPPEAQLDLPAGDDAPQPAPAQMPKPIVPQPAPVPPPVRAIPPKAPSAIVPKAPQPPAKPYSGDPYREPIE